MHLAVRGFNSREESSKLRRRLQLNGSRVIVQRCWQDQIHLFFLFAVTAGFASLCVCLEAWGQVHQGALKALAVRKPTEELAHVLRPFPAEMLTNKIPTQNS